MNRLGRDISFLFALIVFGIYLFKAQALTIQDPWDLTQFILIPWGITFLMILSGYTLGFYFIRLIKPGPPKKKKKKDHWTDLEFGPSETVIISTGIGLAILATIVWGIGWAHGFYTAVLIPLVVVIPLIGRFAVADFFTHLRDAYKNTIKYRDFDLMLILFIAFWILRTMFLTDNPSLGHDPISAHLYAPKLYLQQHGIFYYRQFPFLQLHGMLATIQMSVVRDPGSINPWIYMIMTSGLLFRMANLWFNRTAGLVAIIFYILMPMSHYAGMYHLNEHLLVFYIVLALYSVIRYHETNNSGWLTIAGASAGAACATDINGIMPSFLIIALALKNWWLVFLWGFIFAAPWYAANVVHFGNPIYPFYENLFAWANWGTQEADTVFSTYRRDFYLQEFQGGESHWRDAFTVFFRYTFQPNVEWVEQPVGRIGPFILGFTPLIFFAPLKKSIRFMGIFIIIVYSYWLFYERVYNARFLLYVFSLHSLLSAWGFIYFISNWSVSRRKIVYWTSIAVFLMFAFTVTMQNAGRDVTIRETSRNQYLFTYKPGIIHIDTINRLDIDARVYMLGLDGYKFYCDFPIYGNAWGPDNFEEYAMHCDSPKDLYDWLRTFDVNLLLVNVGWLTDNPTDFDYTKVMQDPEWTKYFDIVEVFEGELEIPSVATRLFALLVVDDNDHDLIHPDITPGDMMPGLSSPFDENEIPPAVVEEEPQTESVDSGGTE